MPPGLDVLTPQLKASFERAYERAAQNTQSVYATLFPKAMRLERAFVKAGGTLVAGTDPTGAGGVVPGYADQRQIELLVEAGFSPLEAISIGRSTAPSTSAATRGSDRLRSGSRRTSLSWTVIPRRGSRTSVASTRSSRTAWASIRRS